MNRQSVINKFIEKAGSLVPVENKFFAYGQLKQDRGLTSRLDKVIELWSIKYWKSNACFPEQDVTTPGHVLPRIEFQKDGFSYFFDTSDLLECMRMLENKPFQKIKVYHFPNQNLPMAFKRDDCDISVLLSPLKFEIPPDRPPTIHKKLMGNPWLTGHPKWTLINQLPNSTYELWEANIQEQGFKSNSVVACVNGYPIAQLIKCRKCGNEIGVQEWVNNKIQRNHPECYCSCDTYDDFCGCIKARESMTYDRLWRQARMAHRYRQLREHHDIA